MFRVSIQNVSAAIAVSLCFGLASNCKSESSGISQYQTDLRAELKQIDFLIKEGAASGELRGGGENFAKARELLETAWKLAAVIKLHSYDEPLFNQLASQYLVFFVRTTCEYQKYSKKILDAFGGAQPKDATILYLLGLGALRDAQLEHNDPTFETSLKYINASLATGQDLPEAHWLKAQILAWRGGQLDKVKEEHEAVARLSDRISPVLYLYDMETIDVIKRACMSKPR